MITWRKSSFSADTVNCVEVAVGYLAAGVRDSKDPGAGYLALDLVAYQGLLTFAKGAAPCTGESPVPVP